MGAVGHREHSQPSLGKEGDGGSKNTWMRPGVSDRVFACIALGPGGNGLVLVFWQLSGSHLLPGLALHSCYRRPHPSLSKLWKERGAIGYYSQFTDQEPEARSSRPTGPRPHT